jgi:hypothetical protein
VFARSFGPVSRHLEMVACARDALFGERLLRVGRRAGELVLGRDDLPLATVDLCAGLALVEAEPLILVSLGGEEACDCFEPRTQLRHLGVEPMQPLRLGGFLPFEVYERPQLVDHLVGHL